MHIDEWRAAQDPTPMVRYLVRRASVRKLRLFAAACGRWVWPLLPSERGRQWVRIAEALADGGPPDCDLEAEREVFTETFDHIDGFRQERANNVAYNSLLVAHGAIEHEAEFGTGSGSLGSGARLTDVARYAAWAWAHFRRPDDTMAVDMEVFSSELASLVPLVRDVFGDPFWRTGFDPRWETDEAVGVARGIYDDRAFERLPVLADALMEVGCDNPVILSHCRSAGPHARGCWVVDLVLGRE